MKIMQMLFLSVVLLIALDFPLHAQERDPEGFTPRGYISNAFGGQCWYTQVYERTNPYFLPEELKHVSDNDLRTIHFDDPECMADVIDGLAVAERINKRLIAIQLSRWFQTAYVAEEVQYDVNQFYKPADGIQTRGVCIKSTTHPFATTIAVEFVSDGDSITKVIYAPSVGCGPRLDSESQP